MEVPGRAGAPSGLVVAAAAIACTAKRLHTVNAAEALLSNSAVKALSSGAAAAAVGGCGISSSWGGQSAPVSVVDNSPAHPATATGGSSSSGVAKFL